MLKSNFDTNFSGSTACTVLIAGNILLCANVGDSRAIMGLLSDRGTETSAAFDTVQLSRDHKPNVPGEYERVVKSNGRVDTYRGCPGLLTLA